MILRLNTGHRLRATPLAPLVRCTRSATKALQARAAASAPAPASRGRRSSLPELLTSPQNAYVKHCCKLRTDASYRSQHDAVLLVGATPLLELAQEVPGLELRTLLWAPRDRPPPAELQASRVLQITDAVLKKISGVKSADGCCDPFNDKALRASRGAAFKLPLASGAWPDLQRVLAHHSLACLAAEPRAYDADTGGEGAVPNAAELQRLGDVALVLGSEGQGLSEAARRHSRPVAVPMRGAMESLSVSQAGAILLFALGGGLPALLRNIQAAKSGEADALDW